MVIVGLSNFIFGSQTSQYSAETQLIALLIYIIALFFGGGCYVTEEKIFSKFAISPL